MFDRRIAWVLLALPIAAHATSYTCRIHGRTVFQEVPCTSTESGAPQATRPATAAPAATQAAPAPRMYLCVAPGGDLAFEAGSCARGDKPIEAEFSESASTQPAIPAATRSTAPDTAFGEPPDPTDSWTQHVRVPPEVVDLVVRMRSLNGQYEVSAWADRDGKHRAARATTCLREARPFDFLDLYKLARAAPHLPPACKLGDFKLSPGRIDYRFTCTQRGKTVTSAAAVFMTKTGVRHEQTVISPAPSDYIRGSRAYEVRRIGECS